MTEQLQTMSDTIRDLKIAGQEVPGKEQVLNVIRAKG